MHLGGVTANPTGEWTVQQARNLALSPGQRSGDTRFLIRGRGPDFTRSFDAVFQATGARILRTAVQAPSRNAICERLVGTLRREVLDRVLIVGERHLHAVLTKYQVHYNTARTHQGIAQRVPGDEPDAARATVTDVDRQHIRRKPVLGGLINEGAHGSLVQLEAELAVRRCGRPELDDGHAAMSSGRPASTPRTKPAPARVLVVSDRLVRVQVPPGLCP